jgi:hypothetical protein
MVPQNVFLPQQGIDLHYLKTKIISRFILSLKFHKNLQIKKTQHHFFKNKTCFNMMNFGAIKNKDTNVMMEISNNIFKILDKDILCSI